MPRAVRERKRDQGVYRLGWDNLPTSGKWRFKGWGSLEPWRIGRIKALESSPPFLNWLVKEFHRFLMSVLNGIQKCFTIKTGWNNHFQQNKTHLKLFQHSPGRYPRCSTNSLWTSSFYIGWDRGLPGICKTGACWGPTSIMDQCVLHNPPNKSPYFLDKKKIGGCIKTPAVTLSRSFRWHCCDSFSLQCEWTAMMNWFPFHSRLEIQMSHELQKNFNLIPTCVV